MPAQHAIDGPQTLPTPTPRLAFVTAPAVPQRSARRATARRASSRRATARQRKDDVEGRIVEYLADHPLSTTGDMAKGLDTNRDTIGEGVSHLVRACEVTRTSKGYAAT